MEKESDIKIGDAVRANKFHWLRANCDGAVIDVDYHREGGCTHAILVQFDDAEIGKGVDGDKLWMNPLELVLKKTEKRTAR